MALFDKVRRALRDASDHAKDAFYQRLQELGLEPQWAPRGRPEEELIRRVPPYGCLGLIDLPLGTIRWAALQISRPGDLRDDYSAAFGVPDEKITCSFPKVSIKAIRVRTPRFFGNVAAIGWKGKDHGLGLMDQLTDGEWPQLMQSRIDLEIRAHPGYGCWTITHGHWKLRPTTGWFKGYTTRNYGDEEVVLTADRWSCYQDIAQLLLATENRPSA